MLPKQSISRLAILTLLTASSLCFVIIKPAIASSNVDSRGNYIPPFPYPFTWSTLIIAGGVGIPRAIMGAQYAYKSHKRKKEREAARLLQAQQNNTKKEETES